jgi:hypothetical protein
MLKSWYIYVRYDKENQELLHDYVRLDSLQLALETLDAVHVERGWIIRRECEAPNNGVIVLESWKPEVLPTGEITAKLKYRRVDPVKKTRKKKQHD